MDLEAITLRIEKALSACKESADGKKRKIAVMGCAVNGTGEARDADLGVACGDGKGVIFARGEILKTVEEEAIAEEMIRMIQEGNFFSKV